MSKPSLGVLLASARIRLAWRKSREANRLLYPSPPPGEILARATGVELAECDRAFARFKRELQSTRTHTREIANTVVQLFLEGDLDLIGVREGSFVWAPTASAQERRRG